MRLALLLLLPALAACASPPRASLPQDKPGCYRLPPDQWGACLERARALDFNVYECERRALYGPKPSTPSQSLDDQTRN